VRVRDSGEEEKILNKKLGRGMRVSPAMLVAMLALFVALTGTAVATTSVLITGAQIKNNSVTGADVQEQVAHQQGHQRATTRPPRP
jgi:hypothetical protein